MSEKKANYRMIAMGLGAVSVLLIVVLAAVFVAPATFGLNAAKTEDNSQTSLQNQVNTLQTQVTNLQAPNLVNVALGADDLGSTAPYSPILHVTGYVINTGTTTAYNCKLHVVAYFITGAKAIDFEFPIGANGVIHSHDSVNVDQDITYSGAGLGGVSAGTATITPEWTTTP